MPLSPVPELMHRSHGEMATGSLGDGDLLYSPLIILQGHCLPCGLLTTAVWHVTELIYFPFSTVVYRVVGIEQSCVPSRRGVPLGGHLVKMKLQLAAKNQIDLH